MSLTLDKKGFPVLLEDDLKLGVVVPTESGNPFHNPQTGRFSFAPPGVNVIKGGEYLEGIKSDLRKYLFEVSKKSGANQLAIKDVNGSLQFVLMRDGRHLGSFSAQSQVDKGETTALSISDPLLRDAIVEAARNPSLTGEKLRAFLSERIGKEIDDEVFEQIQTQIDDQRLNDLIDYVSQNLHRKLDGIPFTNTIRLHTPRGYLQKNFSNLTPEQAQEVITRIQHRGFTEEQVQTYVVAKFPKALREKLEVEHKQKTKSEKKDEETEAS
jgi:hypothetical protein